MSPLTTDPNIPFDDVPVAGRHTTQQKVIGHAHPDKSICVVPPLLIPASRPHRSCTSRKELRGCLLRALDLRSRLLKLEQHRPD
jgi:hypothetical protein